MLKPQCVKYTAVSHKRVALVTQTNQKGKYLYKLCQKPRLPSDLSNPSKTSITTVQLIFNFTSIRPYHPSEHPLTTVDFFLDKI